MSSLDRAEVTVRDVLGRRVRNVTVSTIEQDGHTVATVEAPGYMRKRVILDFNLTADVVLLMDPQQCQCPEPAEAGRRLLELLMRASYVAGRDVYAYLERDTDGLLVERLHVQPDRAYYRVRVELMRDLELSEAWAEAPATLHQPPEWATSWQRPAIVSYKGLEPRCALQLTLWRASSSMLALEVDVDVNAGLRHLRDVIVHRVTGQPDPRIVAQLVTLYRGLRLPWEMRPML